MSKFYVVKDQREEVIGCERTLTKAKHLGVARCGPDAYSVDMLDVPVTADVVRRLLGNLGGYCVSSTPDVHNPKANAMLEYPAAIARRGGSKVDWLYFDSLTDANEASRIAVHNANILERQGYDFGYQSPGHIVKEQQWHPGLIEVCIP